MVGGTFGVGARIAAALAAEGAAVQATDDAEPETLEAAFAAATATHRLTAVVHALLPPIALEGSPLGELDEPGWMTQAEVPVVETIRTLQAAHRHLVGGGQVVVVVAAAGVTGLEGHVGLCTAAEAQRALAKSAARTWGPAGLVVNVLAADLADLAGLGAGAGVSGVRAAALGPADSDDLVALALLLLSPLARRATGVTLFADAGTTMLP